MPLLTSQTVSSAYLCDVIIFSFKALTYPIFSILTVSIFLKLHSVKIWYKKVDESGKLYAEQNNIL